MEIAPQSVNKSETLNIILLCVIIVIFLLHVFYIYKDTGGWSVDDAYISYRYAENFADGKGLVFNPGERVEGYTNFLWVMLLSFFYRIGFYTPDAGFLLGIFFSICAIIFLYKLSHSFYIEGNLKILSLIAPALLAVSNSFALWSMGGLELPLFLFLLLSGFFFLTGKEKIIPGAILLSLSALTRPEGMLFTGFAFVYLCLKKNRDAVKIILFACIALVIIGSHFTFRFLYYSDILPNTFYNKVGFQLTQAKRGWEYLLEFITTYALFLPLVILPVYVPHKRTEIMLFFSLLVIYLVYIIYTGGDPLPAYRLILPVTPFLFLLLQVFFSYLISGSIHQKKPVSLVLFITIFFFAACAFNLGHESFVITWKGKQVFPNEVHKHYINDKVALFGKKIGLFCEEKIPPGALIAVNTAGSIPYYAKNHQFIDMLGLTDKHIARIKMPGFGSGFVGHEKNDAAYVLSRKPDYIILGFSMNTEYRFPGDDALLRHPEFLNRYEKILTVYDAHRFTYYKRVR